MESFGHRNPRRGVAAVDPHAFKNRSNNQCEGLDLELEEARPVQRGHDVIAEIFPGPYLARGQRGQLPPPGKLNLFLTSH